MVKHLCDMLHKGLGKQPFYYRTERRGSGDEIRVTSFMDIPLPRHDVCCPCDPGGRSSHCSPSTKPHSSTPKTQSTAGIEPWGFWKGVAGSSNFLSQGYLLFGRGS